MHLCNLDLYGFRNYRQLHLEADPGVNLIVGCNAQGKTNLLEAISFLGSGRSWRAGKVRELVRFDEKFGDLQAKIFSQGREQSIRCVLYPNGTKRQLWRNGVKKKTFAELSGLLPSVLFCPEDLMVLKSGASARRHLGDTALCQLRPNYDAALTEYGRVLDQKGRILKDYHENRSLLEILPEYNERLIQVGALLISYRARFYRSLGQEAERFHGLFTGGAEEMRLEYRTVSTVSDPFADLETLRNDLRRHLESHARAELESGQCLTGPHKDDFDMTLSGLSLKSFGSQGQVRTAAISLKLAQRELLRRELGEEPVLLLDDVLSELDPGRQDFVLNQIGSGQVFITCCEPGRFTSLGKTIEISQGKIRETPNF